MSDELKIKIGGASYHLAPLPWRVVKRLQPTLYALYVKVMSEGDEKPLGSLTEEDLDTLADAVFASLGHLEAGKPPTREHFDDLPITVAELVRCIPVVARAAGMISRDGKHSQEASDGAGK